MGGASLEGLWRLCIGPLQSPYRERCSVSCLSEDNTHLCLYASLLLYPNNPNLQYVPVFIYIDEVLSSRHFTWHWLVILYTMIGHASYLMYYHTTINTHNMSTFLQQKLLGYIVCLLKMQLLHHHYPLYIKLSDDSLYMLTLTVLNKLN